MTSRSDATTRFNTDGGIHEIPLASGRGRLWLCGKHYIAPDHRRVIDEFSIDTVVCLVERHELAGRYDPYLDWLADDAGKTSSWTPVHDLSFPDIDDAMRWIEPLHRSLTDGASVLVHCAAGIGRAGTTATALMMLQGMDARDAMRHVRSHRPSAGPESGAQQRFIVQLQDTLRGHDT